MVILHEKGPFSVVVCNVRMPDADGIDFLYKVRKIWPNTRRIIMSSVTEPDTLIRMINKARVFHFIRKPCPPQMVEIIISKALKRYSYIAAETDLIERTREAAVKAYLDILAKTNAVAFTRASRVASVVAQLVKILDLRDGWQYEFAGRLSQIGWVSAPPDVLEKMYANADLNSVEIKMAENFPKWGYELISDLPKVDSAAAMILHQRDDFTGPTMPDPPKLSEDDRAKIRAKLMAAPPPYDPYASENLAYLGDLSLKNQDVLGAELLRVAADLETYISCGLNLVDAIVEMKEKKNRKKYNPQLIAVLGKIVLPEAKKKIMEVPITQINKNMYFEENVCALTGALLATKGQKVAPMHRQHFEKYLELHNIQETVKVSILSYE